MCLDIIEKKSERTFCKTSDSEKVSPIHLL
uniref:Uncharacterized protein n=1 Tax=Rhizophora mucronata TaxID=61149 RepID=A0A2P2R0C7_RHIMU